MAGRVRQGLRCLRTSNEALTWGIPPRLGGFAIPGHVTLRIVVTRNGLHRRGLCKLQFRARPMHSARYVKNYHNSTLSFLLGLAAALTATIVVFRLIQHHFMR